MVSDFLKKSTFIMSLKYTVLPTISTFFQSLYPKAFSSPTPLTFPPHYPLQNKQILILNRDGYSFRASLLFLLIQ